MPEPSFDYEACLAACARHDPQALRDLYRQESPRLLGVALRIARDRGLAEDIVHDTFIRVWTRAASFDPARGTARGWVYSITRHLALNFVRDHGRETPVGEATHEAASVSFELPTGRIQHCLEQLEPARRQCILHAYVDGCSHAEIAQRLGTPLGTVKAWIKRSLAALRECMG
ncbi:sigma-70 family RNA polymerase sigma factor [Pseudomonas entomophila]|uniref:sigma-70 family RNA polymerase sigma factor n=1 Tax=Pseudomonas entomophila TaxID=312306 RepID=UPI0023D81DE1|nr:sigma-70 family RNA polymerase sigma factor [Pseudomonas entomophila]MDF0732743.1 sigma-70 family RNA polymerase sigma factor [Pseudomonas entomophila]